MILLILIALHLFFISLYALLISKGKSHLQFSYLIFALFLPFIGEICMVFADLSTPELIKANQSAIQDVTFEGKPISKSADLVQTLCFGNGVSARNALSVVFDEKPQNTFSILKLALNARDSEVVHLSAAALMNYQRKFENSIRTFEEECAYAPSNATLITDYYNAIQNYISSGLPDDCTMRAYKDRQIYLCERYLALMPSSYKCGMRLAALYEETGKRDMADAVRTRFVNANLNGSQTETDSAKHFD